MAYAAAMGAFLINCLIVAAFVLAMLACLGFAWWLGSLFNAAGRKLLR